MKKLCIFMFLLGSLTVHSPDLDQDHFIGITSDVAFPYGIGTGQSFTAGITGSMTSVSVSMTVQIPNLTDDICFQTAQQGIILLEGEGLTGNVLSSSFMSLSNSSGLLSFILDTPIPVVAGNQYTILFSYDLIACPYSVLSYDAELMGSYADGIAFIDGNRVENDFLFQTYVIPGGVIPTLSQWGAIILFLSIGTIGLLYMRKDGIGVDVMKG